MLEEVQIIQSNGIPIYSYGKESEDHLRIIQAGFFTAMSNFSKEINVGQLKSIIFDERQYRLRKAGTFLFVFSDSEEKTHEKSKNLEEKLLQVSDKFVEEINKKNLTGEEPDIIVFDEPLVAFNQELINKNLIKEDKLVFEPKKSRKRIQNMLFKSIGYTPGQCNIGKRQRQKRLVIGLISFLISVFILIPLIYFDMDRSLRLLLVIPNIAGFLGFYQSFFKFCVANGISEKYTMD